MQKIKRAIKKLMKDLINQVLTVLTSRINERAACIKNKYYAIGRKNKKNKKIMQNKMVVES